MASDQGLKTTKTFPTILSKLRAMRESAGSQDQITEEGGTTTTTTTTKTRKLDLGSSGCSSDLRDLRGTPRLAWVASSNRKDSLYSSTSSHDVVVGAGGGPGSRSIGVLSRISSMASLGGSGSAWSRRLKKKRDAEEYAALKAARQREEMNQFYKGTPVVDDRATSSEILQFLYELWTPQLCANYRSGAKITTTARQDMRSARRIAQTTPRRVARLHRARIVIDTCNQMDQHRTSVPTRPRSARSIT